KCSGGQAHGAGSASQGRQGDPGSGCEGQRRQGRLLTGSEIALLNSASKPWLHRFAWLTAAVTLALIGVGGMVTSRGAGLAVPDWPNSFGYSMFLFPVSKWIGGIFYEHTHRLVASCLGVLVVILTRW